MWWSSLCALLISRAILAGANAPDRVNHARQVKGKKSDKCSETLVEVATASFNEPQKA